MGEVLDVIDRSLVGDFSLEAVLLEDDCERCRVSSRTSSKLTLSCEYGRSHLSMISTNFEVDMSRVLFVLSIIQDLKNELDCACIINSVGCLSNFSSS